MISLLTACSFINNKDANALIIPDDVCLNCQGLGYIMGDAYYPTIATDQASQSGAIKMYPIFEDMIDMVAGVIKYYRWTTFIFLYDQDSGEPIVCQRNFSHSSVFISFYFTILTIFSLIIRIIRKKNSRICQILNFIFIPV